MKEYLEFINEGFFSKKKDYIEVVQDELTNIDDMTDDDFRKLKKSLIDSRKNINKTINAQNAVREQSRRIYFKNKWIKLLTQYSIDLYKLAKYSLDKEIEVEKMKVDFEGLSDFYTGINLNKNLRKSIDNMSTITYILNCIDALFKNKGAGDNFYIRLDDNKFKFGNRRKEKKEHERNAGVDPFGEEDWSE